MFTPFYKTWCHLIETNPYYLDLAHAPEPNHSEARTLFQKHFAATIPTSHPHGLDVAEIQRLFPAGEQAAHARLNEFVQQRAAQYHVRRDVPHEQQGCSMLSAYLNAGVLSTRQCVVAARAANRNKIVAGDEGLKTWIKELGWRVQEMADRKMKETSRVLVRIGCLCLLTTFGVCLVFHLGVLQEYPGIVPTSMQEPGLPADHREDPVERQPGPFPGVVPGQDRVPDRGRRNAAAEHDRVHAQPAAHDRCVLPGQGLDGQLAVGRKVLYAAVDRRGPGV